VTGEAGAAVPPDAASADGASAPLPPDAPGVVEGAPGAMLVIISGPAGVGKDTILKELKLLPSAARREFVVTYKSREPRWDEVDGVHYHFVSPDRFHEIHRAGGLLEAAEVHGQWSGTPIEGVRRALVAGRDAILKIDVQGAATVKGRVPDALRIFVSPPSIEELRRRLEERNTETAEQLAIRLHNAEIEMREAPRYDHTIVNVTALDGAKTSARRIDALIDEEHARRGACRIRV
jgi:guanylate kinase